MLFKRGFVLNPIWMEGELPSVQNNVTFQVAVTSTTFEKLDCFIRCKRNAKARAFDSSSSGKYIFCGSSSCPWRRVPAIVLLFLSLSAGLGVTRDLCIQTRPPELCSCTEMVSVTWFWKPSNTLLINLVLRSQLNSFTCSCLNWQEVYKHQQSYTDRRPTVEQSVLWVLSMGLCLQKQAWCAQFLHLWRVHRTTESRCCHATSLQVLQLLKLNWSFAAICWWLPITSGSFSGNFRFYLAIYQSAVFDRCQQYQYGGLRTNVCPNYFIFF